MPRNEPISRSQFLQRSMLLAATAFVRVDRMAQDRHPLEHPDPRPGITSERVLAVDALGKSSNKRVLAAYDAARHSPEIFDGLACACGCTGKDAPHRSLLVCFETQQPTGCWSCQEEGEFVGKLVADGKSLAEIRAAVDKKFA